MKYCHLGDNHCMTHKVKIAFLDRMSIPTSIQIRPAKVPHDYIEYDQTRPQQLVKRLEGVTVAITNKVKLPESVLTQLPDLKMIAVAATGTDHVDLEYCMAHNIAVRNVIDYAVESVPEHVFCLILALRRNLMAYDQAVKAGKWQKSSQFCLLDYPIGQLSELTLGIIGAGALGKATARMGEALGLNVCIADHKTTNMIMPGRRSFKETLECSDIISIHIPLTTQTKDLIAAPEFEQMKSTALLINTARGGIVNEADLCRALVEGQIGGAGIDVLTQEPPKNGNPLLELDLPNLIITPHIAWGSHQAIQSLADQLIDNIDDFFNDQT